MEDIKVLDHLLDANEQYNLSIMAHNSSLTLGWEDKDWGEGAKDKFIHSQWDLRDIKRSGILDSSTVQEELKERGLSIHNFDKAILNVDTIADSHWTHVHPGKTVLLYYLLEDWQDGWAGETLFFDRSNPIEVAYCSRYVPNRGIIFDGEIPHSVRAPSRSYPHKYRYTLATIFSNSNKQRTNNE